MEILFFFFFFAVEEEEDEEAEEEAPKDEAEIQVEAELRWARSSSHDVVSGSYWVLAAVFVLLLSSFRSAFETFASVMLSALTLLSI
jgi:hypothetical protein